MSNKNLLQISLIVIGLFIVMLDPVLRTFGLLFPGEDGFVPWWLLWAAIVAVAATLGIRMPLDDGSPLGGVAWRFHRTRELALAFGVGSILAVLFVLMLVSA